MPSLISRQIEGLNRKLGCKILRELVTRLDLVDKFREKHPSKVEWTGFSEAASSLLSSNQDIVLGV